MTRGKKPTSASSGVRSRAPAGAAIQGSSEAPDAWLVRAAAAALFLLIAALCFTKVRDLDTWWHLKTGQLILSSGIPRTDPFSYVLEGRRWVTFEWLSQVLLWLAFRAGGAAGLTVLKTLAVASAFLIVFRLNRARPLWAFLCLSTAALAMDWAFVERPWLFDLPALAALMAILWEGAGEDPSPAARWGLPILAAAWANLHGAVALLVPILSTAAVAAERFRRRGAAWGPWAAPLCLSFAAVLATPHGTALFPQMWRTVTYPGKARIRDWAPPWIELPGLYGALLVLGLWAAWRLREKRPACAAWTALLAAASLTMTRNVPLYLLAAGAAAARAWDPSLLKEHERRALAACLLAVAAGAGLQARANAFLEGKRGIGTIEPLAGAAAFIKEADLPGRMFNEYESGGYLIWALAPGRKVFLDGRNAEFDPPVLHRGLSWYRPEVWRALDNAWGFDYALIARHVTGAYTAKVLEDDPAWAPVYWDDEAMVYLRRTPAHRPLLERYGYALVKPGRASQQYLEPILEKGGGPALLKELDRSVAECRRGPINALLLRAYVLARLGRAAQAGESAEDAVRRAPGRAQPLMTLGWVRLAAGDLEGARLAYEEAAARVRRDERPALGADVLNNLGRVYEKQGDRGRAAEAYRRALAWNPGHGEAFQNLRRLE